MANKKRFGIFPLPKREAHLALPGELIFDEETGTTGTVDENGNYISSTDSLKETVTSIIEGGVLDSSLINEHNHRVYRLYFDGTTLRIDQELKLHDSIRYYRVVDIATGLAITEDIVDIGTKSFYITPIVDNELYNVLLYNADRQVVSQLTVTAKFAETIPVAGEPGERPSHIKIQLNRDTIYDVEIEDALKGVDRNNISAVSEALSKVILTQIHLYYDTVDCDEVAPRYKDVTASTRSTVTYYIDYAGVTPVVRAYGFYYYDTVNGLRLEDSEEICIIKENPDTVKDVVVIPRKVVVNGKDANGDPMEEIKLTVIVYYEDGSTRNLRNEFVTYNFDEKLFDIEQRITVAFNTGHISSYKTPAGQEVPIFVSKSGSNQNESGANIVYFGNRIMSLDTNFRYHPEAVSYRVRYPYDLNFYYTLGSAILNHSTSYLERPYPAKELYTGSPLIVEFYNAEDELVDSELFFAKYKEETVGE